MQLRLEFTDEALAKIEAKALSEGSSVEDWIRRRADEAYEEHTRKGGSDSPEQSLPR
jgi:hypothetical protein